MMEKEEQLTAINMIKANLETLENATQKGDKKKDRTSVKRWCLENIIAVAERLKDSL